MIFFEISNYILLKIEENSFLFHLVLTHLIEEILKSSKFQ